MAVPLKRAMEPDRLIDPRDDANLGEAPDQHLALLRDVGLLIVQLAVLAASKPASQRSASGDLAGEHGCEAVDVAYVELLRRGLPGRQGLASIRGRPCSAFTPTELGHAPQGS